MRDFIFKDAKEVKKYSYITVGELIRQLKGFDKKTPVIKRYMESEYSTVHEENYISADFDPERGIVVIE